MECKEKTKLTTNETLLIATMLFGLFFGAGNLIFPVYMGQLAGSNVWSAIAGFLITAVGLPLLGVASIGISRSDGLVELSGKVGRGYSIAFTCALYLSIGPFFAIPRCATVPFTVAVSGLLPPEKQPVALAIFSLLFFASVLLFSLKPGKILTYVGKFLTPVFLVLLGVLVVTALIKPMAAVSELAPLGAYADNAFITGFLDGYNTMDALASLAFGIVIINVIRGLGVKEPQAVAVCTAKSGIFSCLIMAVIYVFVTIVGTESRGAGIECANGGEVLSLIASHYFGRAGALVLAAIATFACLKTSIGLVTSCSETFCELFPKGPCYRVWAIVFSIVSFLIANVGLSAIIDYSVPVLMLLYPLAITLILLGLFGRFFRHDRAVYVSVTAFTFLAALLDFVKALPRSASAAMHLEGVIEAATSYLPLFREGLGWLCPALVGLIVGLILHCCRRRRTAA